MNKRTVAEASVGTNPLTFKIRAAGLPDNAKFLLDPERTTLRFRAKAFLLRWVTGTVRLTSGAISIAHGSISGDGAADAASVSTGLGPRDWHLRTGHYLHSKRHQEVRLRVDGSDLSSRDVDAELEVRGQKVSFPLTISELDARGDELFLKAWGVFDRRGLGMLPPIAGVSRSVDVELNIVAKRADAVP
jgi:polyisoprenoid-binding protein YceI